MRKRDILIGLIISLLVVPSIVVGIAMFVGRDDSPKLTNNPPARSESDIVKAIIKSRPGLADDHNKPVFTVSSFKRISGNWYIVWLDDSSTKALINDPAYDALSMQVLLGPGTVFNQEDASSRGIPDTIYKEFTDAQA